MTSRGDNDPNNLVSEPNPSAENDSKSSTEDSPTLGQVMQQFMQFMAEQIAEMRASREEAEANTEAIIARLSRRREKSPEIAEAIITSLQRIDNPRDNQEIHRHPATAQIGPPTGIEQCSFPVTGIAQPALTGITQSGRIRLPPQSAPANQSLALEGRTPALNQQLGPSLPVAPATYYAQTAAHQASFAPPHQAIAAPAMLPAFASRDLSQTPPAEFAEHSGPPPARFAEHSGPFAAAPNFSQPPFAPAPEGFQIAPETDKFFGVQTAALAALTRETLAAQVYDGPTEPVSGPVHFIFGPAQVSGLVNFISGPPTDGPPPVFVPD